MTNQHSMTAPNALVVECMNQFLARGGGLGKLKDIVEIAFQAGADAAFQAGADPYRAMCAELLLFSEEAGEICYNESLWPSCDPDCTLQDRARALLAQTESKGPSLKEQAMQAIVDIENLTPWRYRTTCCWG